MVAVNRSPKPVPKMTLGSWIFLLFLMMGFWGLILIVTGLLTPFVTDNQIRTTQLIVGALLFSPGIALYTGMTLVTFRRWNRAYSRVSRLVLAGSLREAQRVALANRDALFGDPVMGQLVSMTHMELREYRQALLSAQQAVDARKSGQTLAQRAAVLFTLGAYEEALADIEDSLKRLRSPRSYILKLGILTSLRRSDDVRSYLAKQPKVSDTFMLFNIAEAYRIAGEAESARVAYGKTLTIGRDDPRFRSFVACTLAELGDYDAAEEEASPGVDSTSADVMAIYTMLLCWTNRGDFDSALRGVLALALVSPGFAVAALRDPELSPLMAELRLRELFVTCDRLQRQDIEWARAVICDAPSNDPPEQPLDTDSAAPHSAPIHWPTPEETWGPA